MTATSPGLRARKKQATRTALREAALRLAMERGPDNVRVEDIAEAAGVSPRTYNNYFASRDQAIVSALNADREVRIASAVEARPRTLSLSKAVVDAVVEQYTMPRDDDPQALLLMTTGRPALREALLDATGAIERPLASVLADQLPAAGEHTARVLAAGVASAVRVALEVWLVPADPPRPAGGRARAGLVVPAGSLSDHLRAALAVLAPALDAAERGTTPAA